MTGRLPRLEDGGVLAGVKAKSEWTGLRPGLDPDCGRRPNAVSGSQGKIYNATRSKTTNLGSLRFQGIAAAPSARWQLHWHSDGVINVTTTRIRP
jgi:hypothetical protein